MKKRLLLSILSLLLSLAMLTGTTFAWFTDSVSSGRNRIVAGNLDIALYNGSTPVTENTLLFDEITYWEPGVVAWDNLTVANEGTLALSLQLGVVLTATQLPKQADSFGSDYDAAAGAVTRVTRDSQVLSNVKTDLPENSIAASRGVVFATAPYAYTDTALFAGKHIVKLGIPVKTVKALDGNQTFTLSVVKTTSNAYEYVSQLELKLPLEQLGNFTTVNKWVYVDLELQLAQDETLAFGGSSDTVTWAWKSGYSDTTYRFRNVNQNWNQYSCGIFFDVYAETVYTYAQYQQELKAEQERLEAEQAQQRLDEALQKVLGGRKLSILGNSISTYTGYNSTIGGNAIYYNGSRDGFTAVNETWWMQTLSRSGMELLVNNSWSGDTVTGRGISRSLQLHNNEGQTPDIIAVYLGINDFRTKVTAAAFAEKYDEMISGMKVRYPDAEVYLFTPVYTTNVNSGVSPDDVVYFNDAIKATAQKYGCTLVDLYGDSGINKTNLSTYMGDGKLHPNYAGMDLITQCFLDALCKAYLSN